MFESAFLKIYQILPEWSRLKNSAWFEAKINHFLLLKIDKERYKVIKMRWEKEKLQRMLDDLGSADGQK